MKKIPTLFERDWNGDRSRVLDVPTPGCSWVFAGEGVATRKLDGTCCLVRENKLYKRREIKANEKPPVGFEPVDLDETTGKTTGWVPVDDTPGDCWHREAFSKQDEWPNGTYELIGPKIQGNPEHFAEHTLIPHSATKINGFVPRAFSMLRDFLQNKDIEGIVFHHPDGRMAKIKLRDFGFKRRSA